MLWGLLFAITGVGAFLLSIVSALGDGRSNVIQAISVIGVVGSWVSFQISARIGSPLNEALKRGYGQYLRSRPSSR
jgi:hypothetical protein